MLKALKPDTFAGIANAKCGEVYFQSLNSYRIDCAFCHMKSFVFADFLLHIQNEHFEDGLLKADVILPKQEDMDGSTSATQTNLFSWYEVTTNEYDLDANSGTEFLGETKQLVDDDDDEEEDELEDPVGIMKWDVSAERLYNNRIGSDADNSDARDQEQESPPRVTKEQLACIHCNKTYQSKKSLQRHMERQHKYAGATSEDDVDVDIDADYEPPKVHPPKPSTKYKCEHCDKVYHGKYTLRQHVKRDHDISLSDAFVCLECNAQLPRLRLLDEHVVKVHGGAPCVICNRRYKTRHELKRHQLKHTNERDVPCTHPGCEKRFFTTRHMRNHSKVHSEQKNFVCESCGYSCRNKETLRVHLRSHTGERPFGCKVCDKRFPSHSGLREHMAMHSTERPHVCKVCGATFSRQKGLYHHKFLHAATKQFVCKLCGNEYAQAAGLAGHMRKHRNDELNG